MPVGLGDIRNGSEPPKTLPRSWLESPAPAQPQPMSCTVTRGPFKALMGHNTPWPEISHRLTGSCSV